MSELLKLYQGHGPLPNGQGVPEGPQRKNHVVRPYALGFSGTWLAQDDCGMRINSRMHQAKSADRTIVAIGGGSGSEHLSDDIIMFEA